MADKNPIFIWINEERYEQLEKLGLAHHCTERLAGLKVLTVNARDDQAATLVTDFGAKHDTSTTGSVELLPRKVKNAIFDKIVEKKSLDVMDDVLKEVKP
jgi:hypothetical protein